MAVQGHSRSLILVAIDSAYGTGSGVLQGPDSEGFVVLACVTLIRQQGVTDRLTEARLCHS